MTEVANPTLSANRVDVANYREGIDLYRRNGWTDGHPIVLPTEDEVREWFRALGADPQVVVGRSPARNRTVRLEHVVINALMAGCSPEHVPLVVACIRAVLEPLFQHNHLASLGGPWPFFIVSGPIVDDVALNYDQYVLGPGHAANSVVGRAVSLVFSNCLDQRIGGVQRGAYGASWRIESLLPERPSGPWTTLSQDRGFADGASTVTAFPATGFEQVLVHLLDTPERILAPMIDSLATGRFVWGPYVLVFPPNMVSVFEDAGWRKTDVVDYVKEHTKRSVADLKRRTRWAEQQAGRRPWSDLIDVRPGEEHEMIYLFKPQPEYYDIAFRDKFLDSRDSELIVMNAGGDSGPCAYILIPYTESGPVATTVEVAPLGIKGG